MLTGEIIGDIHINVCKTPDGITFFYIEATNKEVLPILNYVESTLEEY